MAKQTNQVNRDLKRQEAKIIDPSLLYVRELRGKSFKEQSHTTPIRQPSPGPPHVHGATQNPKTTSYLPPPVSQSTPASISSISSQSSSEPDTDHSDMIDETIKHVTHTFNQTLRTPSPCNISTNRDSINPP